MGEPVLGDGLDAVFPPKTAMQSSFFRSLTKTSSAGLPASLSKKNSLWLSAQLSFSPFSVSMVYTYKVGSCEYGLLSRNPVSVRTRSLCSLTSMVSIIFFVSSFSSSSWCLAWYRSIFSMSFPTNSLRFLFYDKHLSTSFVNFNSVNTSILALSSESDSAPRMILFVLCSCAILPSSSLEDIFT